VRKHLIRCYDLNMNFRKQVDVKAKKQTPLAGSSKLCNEPSVQRNFEFASNQQLNYCRFFPKEIPFLWGNFGSSSLSDIYSYRHASLSSVLCRFTSKIVRTVKCLHLSMELNVPSHMQRAHIIISHRDLAVFIVFVRSVLKWKLPWDKLRDHKHMPHCTRECSQIAR